jgi:hypothetical protein
MASASPQPPAAREPALLDRVLKHREETACREPPLQHAR